MARTATMNLSGSGLNVELTMPNLFAVLAKSGTLPNPALASVIKLLDGAGLLEQSGEMQKIQQSRENLRGLYEIAAMCLARPVLRLEGVIQEGEIGPEDLAFDDLFDIYYRFFRASPAERRAQSDAADQDVDGTEDVAPDRENVRRTTKRAVKRN